MARRSEEMRDNPAQPPELQFSTTCFYAWTQDQGVGLRPIFEAISASMSST